MRKLSILFLTMLFVLCISACGEEESKEKNDTRQNTVYEYKPLSQCIGK